MIREIVKDTEVLQLISVKAKPSSKHTKQVISDLLDTAIEHKDKCVGLSAIQIGEPVRVFVAFDGEKFVSYINPVIIRKYGEKYESIEGCMSLEGLRTTNRYTWVDIIHQRGNKFVKETHTGFYAKILQHEVDHLNGVLI
jgi:peptide deformylase